MQHDRPPPLNNRNSALSTFIGRVGNDPGRASPIALEEALEGPVLSLPAGGALLAARAGRAIIADEMGPGKTIEGLAATQILA